MKFIITAILVFITFNSFSQEKLTTKDLYEKFNMRTIFSSYGQRLKYYCNSYPKEFFAKKDVKFISNNHLELVSGSDVWTFTIVSPNVITLANQITSGTYKSVAEYTLHFDSESEDWKANETYIDIPKKCVPFKLKSQ